MPAIQDKERKTWTAQFYYINYKGEKKRKRKRGFLRKRDALQYEREFLMNHADDVTLNFSNFVDEYFKDIKNRIRESTYEHKKNIFETKILPYFGDYLICDITPKNIRDWQNELLRYRNKDGKPYTPSYLKGINNQLNTLFNYGVKYCNLKENPCIKAGSIGSQKPKERVIWTVEDLQKFLDAVGNKSLDQRIAVVTLFYSGLRIGELLALTPEDFDFLNCTINVNKSYTRVKEKNLISPPKTKKSARIVPVPKFVLDPIEKIISRRKLKKDERVFTFCSSTLGNTIKKYADKAGIPKIRIHDLRHSHASLLAHEGFTPNLVADRLGHEKVDMTLNTYTHVYDSSKNEVVMCLESKRNRITTNKSVS